MMKVYLNANGLSYLNNDIQMLMQPDVFTEDIIVRAIEDIEEVFKIEGLAMHSKNHGVKSPESLSNGMKALILLTYAGRGDYNTVISNSCMGANCAKYLQELSLLYDFSIAWDCFMDMKWDCPMSAKDMETGTVFTNGKDFYNFYEGKVGL